MNDNNQYLPIFGTCLGYELLLYLSANDREFRGKCMSQRQSIALNFTNGKIRPANPEKNLNSD